MVSGTNRRIDNTFLIFVLLVSMFTNIGVFIKEAIAPASAEHWHVGVVMIGLSLITLGWYSIDKDPVKWFTFVVLVVNGILAILLDVIYWLVVG